MKKILSKTVFAFGMVLLAPFGIIAALSSGICSLIWCGIDALRDRLR